MHYHNDLCHAMHELPMHIKIRRAIKSLKVGKAAGTDGLATEFLSERWYHFCSKIYGRYLQNLGHGGGTTIIEKC